MACCAATWAALAAENLALRQQLAVLIEQKKRPRLRKRDRIFWAGLSRFWSNWRSVLRLDEVFRCSLGLQDFFSRFHTGGSVCDFAVGYGCEFPVSCLLVEGDDPTPMPYLIAVMPLGVVWFLLLPHLPEDFEPALPKAAKRCGVGLPF